MFARADHSTIIDNRIKIIYARWLKAPPRSRPRRKDTVRMVIEPHLESNYVIIWVPNSERNDDSVNESIRNIIADNHKKKIKTVVFRSGTQDFPEQTARLLELNAKKLTHSQETDYKSVELFIKMWYNIFAKQNRQ